MNKILAFLICLLPIFCFSGNPGRYGGGSGNRPWVFVEKYPTFLARQIDNGSNARQYFNCSWHGKVNKVEATMCDANGKRITKTGCEQCLKKEHDKNVAALKERDKKAEEVKKKQSNDSANSKMTVVIIRFIGFTSDNRAKYLVESTSENRTYVMLSKNSKYPDERKMYVAVKKLDTLTTVYDNRYPTVLEIEVIKVYKE